MKSGNNRCLQQFPMFGYFLLLESLFMFKQITFRIPHVRYASLYFLINTITLPVAKECNRKRIGKRNKRSEIGHYQQVAIEVYRRIVIRKNQMWMHLTPAVAQNRIIEILSGNIFVWIKDLPFAVSRYFLVCKNIIVEVVRLDERIIIRS